MADFIQNIYKWYNQNLRNLPWRKTNDPYKIWISEIILQQTRVAQGIKYYLAFIERFPTVNDLASASENDVLKLWQGLGYYSRARNLHAAARQIVQNHNGVFPTDYDEIINLKGIGPYTAAAVASIAFNLPYPALDGNIYRVLARYFGISTPVNTEKGKKEFLETAQELMPESNPGFHNQALMEFGALQCIPKNPDCLRCPIMESCYAAKQNKVNRFPVKNSKPKQRIRYFYYYFLDAGKETWLEKRTGNDIWKNLYQFPLAESRTKLTEKEILVRTPLANSLCPVQVKSISPYHKHILSHQIIYAR
ncbi:MAG TPA: A/G-specific adenine glycosylase, partial [Mariniphaga anaerophila]|nr:A/G-specific adenine glycosylase [Mariniphaga anaerophila]